ARDGAAVLNAGREAGRGGAVPDGVAGGVGEGADFDLGHADFGEWSDDGVLLGGALAGAVIAAIIGVHSVGQMFVAEFGAQGFHDGEKLVFAVEAAVAVVA